MRKLGRAVALMGVLAAAFIGAMGCAGDAPDDGGPVFGAPKPDASLQVERSVKAISGSLDDNGVLIAFKSAEGEGGVIDIRVEVDGMILTDHIAGQDETLAGVNASDGSPTLLTDVDRAAVKRLLAALEAELFVPVDHVDSKAEYDAARALTPAEDHLFRVLDGRWSQWPSSLPLAAHVGGDQAHGWTSWRKFASTNTTVTGCHDCNVCSFSGDCCDTGKKLGEYWNAANYGNCGTSSTGTQYTKDCTNHDQCVRTTKHGGHSLTSAYCDDQFSACVDDNTFAPSCKYDWRGTTHKGNCPASWNGDGSCDCFCQFQDSDC